MSNNRISANPIGQLHEFLETANESIGNSVSSFSRTTSPLAEQLKLSPRPVTDTRAAFGDSANTSVTSRVRAKLPTSPNGDVRKLTSEDAKLAMDRFRGNLSGWKPQQDISRFDDEQMAWNEKLSDTLMYLDEAQHCASTADQVVGVFVSDAPVGFAVLDKRGDDHSDLSERHAYLSALVVHPGSRRVGGILMELAASTSQEWGSECRIRLAPGSAESILAYKALGFTDALDDEESMDLDPAQAAGWEKRENSWKLSKFLNEPVINGLGPPQRSIRD